MLALKEILNCLADFAFAAAKDKPLYVRDGVGQLQNYIRQFPQCASAVVTRDDLIIDSANAENASEPQWVFVRELRELLPDAIVTLRLQRLSWKRDPKAPVLRMFFVLVSQQVGPFTVRREYLTPAG